jgi:hypothetical protein
MSIGTCQVECSGCKEETKVKIIRPDYFTPSVGTYICECCGSTVQYRIAKVKNSPKVTIGTRVVKPSVKLFDFLNEEKAKEQENETRDNG